jgi:hypothetical protein
MIYQLVTRTLWGFLLIGTIGLAAQPRKSVTIPPDSAPAQPPTGGQLTPPSKAEPPKPVLQATASARPFQVGEKLSFNVSWANFVTAARLELEVAGQGAYFGQQGYQLRTKVSTLGYVRTIFNEIDNQYVSYVDAKTLLPYRTDNTTRQGKTNEDDTVTIDQQRRTARYGDNSELALPADTFDLPSLVYALRLREFGEGAKPTKFTALFGKTLVGIEATVKNRERITTQAGNYEVIRVDLKARTKDKTEYNVRVWFSDDKQRVPVVMQSKTSFGDVRAELTQVSINPQLNKANLVAVNNAPPEIASRDPRIALETAEAAPSEFESSLPFALGERISYDVEWLSLGNIGKVNLAIQRRGKLDHRLVFEMVGEMATIGSARSIINLDDHFKSYVDVDSLLPIRTETNLREGKRRKDIVAIYKDNSVRLDNGTHFNVNPRTLDLVSLFYSVRASNLTIGSNQTFHFVDANHRPRTITIKVVKQEAINSALGTRDTLQLDIINHEGNQLLAQAWVTNDARRWPLYIVTRLAFGEIRLNIKSVVDSK